MSARACICWRPSCFSRTTGSILGLLYGTALASPHRSGPSKLPGHVSLRRFETAKLPGHLQYLLPRVSGLLRPPCLTPACQGVRGFETAAAKLGLFWVYIRHSKVASPHRSGPSKLPGHVSLRRVETFKLPGHVSFASRLWPATASLPHSSLPRCLVMYL